MMPTRHGGDLADRTPGALYADPAIICTADVVNDDEEVGQCREMSRYVVERSDGNRSFGAGGGTEEACEAHLGDAVTGMVNGEHRICAIVTIRWDRP